MGPRLPTILLSSALLALLASVSGCGHSEAAPAAAVPKKEASPQDEVIRFVKNPDAAPAFELRDLDGKPLSLGDARGKIVLLNFWATWCEPCKIEMPWLVEFEKQYRDEGFEVLGVAMKSRRNDTAEFAKRMGLNYAVVMGNGAVADSYGGLNGLPISFFVDRNGRIVATSLGLTSRNEIEQDIRKVLHAPSTQRPATSASARKRH